MQNVHRVKLVLKASARILVRFSNVVPMLFVKHLHTEQCAYVPKDSKETLELVVVGKQNASGMWIVLKIVDVTTRAYVSIHVNK